MLPPLAAVLVVAAAPLAGADDPRGAADLHAPFDVLLRDLVKDGVVDYRGFKEREKELDRYLEALGGVDVAKMGREERLALWINAYNAFTIKLILERYPGVKSIREIPGRWDRARWKVGGTLYSLDAIEHRILRVDFAEPRIHFAIVCASRSCPDLLSEAYRAETIDEQLSRAARRFLSDRTKGFRARSEPGLLYGTNHVVHLSSIFKWFGEDFEAAEGSVIDFLVPYLPEEGRKFVEEHRKDIVIRYFPYDWSLNGR